MRTQALSDAMQNGWQTGGGCPHCPRLETISPSAIKLSVRMKETILANSRSVTPYKQRRCRLTVWSSIKPWPVATTGQTSSSTAILLRLLSASSPSSVPTLQRATLFFPQAPSPECLTVMVVACQPGHSKPTHATLLLRLLHK